jgi:Fe-S cluster biosynthesis and repair protein YggX
MARTVNCIKLGKELDGMDFPPYPGELGKKIYMNVSKEAWAAWLKQQTMLVNENRLSLADPAARKYLSEQTEKYFFGDGADTASGYVPITSSVFLRVKMSNSVRLISITNQPNKKYFRQYGHLKVK